MVAGYIIARNFKAFNESKKAWVTWIIAIGATAAIFSLAFMVTETFRGIPIAYTVVAYALIRHYQGAKIDAHVKAGGPTHGYGNIIGVSIIGLVITIIPAIIIAVAVIGIDEIETQNSREVESSVSREYQALKHKIYYLQSNISVEEVDKLADGLAKAGFFDDASQKQVYVRKVNDAYEVSIPCTKVITTDPESYKDFIPLRNDMQQLFPGHKIILNLVVDNLDNVVKRIE